MQPRHKILARKQLSETLTRLAPMKTINAPGKGWIRAIRETLGMTGEQLGRQLQTNKQRVSRIEQDEIQGRLTLTTLRSVAEALDCTLVYGLVPKQSLEASIKQRATLLAQKRVNRRHQMMRLETRPTNPEETSLAIHDLTNDIMDEMPKALWEEL
jgi:predicted DNA-binding mobile mystery protein A